VVVVPLTRRPSSGVLQPLGRVLVGTVQYGLLALATGLVAAHLLLGLSLHGVLSNSMEPTFSAGDYVLVLDQDPTTLRTGQVPLLSFEEGVTRAHRIVQVSEERGTVRVLTRGDANAAPDPWSDLDAETPVPVVVASIPAAPAAFEALRFVHTNALPAAVVIGLGGLGLTAWAIRRQYVRLRDCECDDCAGRRHADELQEIR
jgi:signal peptidase I